MNFWAFNPMYQWHGWDVSISDVGINKSKKCLSEIFLPSHFAIRIANFYHRVMSIEGLLNDRERRRLRRRITSWRWKFKDFSFESSRCHNIDIFVVAQENLRGICLRSTWICGWILALLNFIPPRLSKKKWRALKCANLFFLYGRLPSK